MKTRKLTFDDLPISEINSINDLVDPNFLQSTTVTSKIRN